MLIRLKVTADTKKDEFEELSLQHYKLSVKAPAERNQANKAVLALIKEKFGAKRVRMISGHHTSSKIVDIVY